MGKTAQELNQLYSDGETADKALFAEMRSNLLLVAGKHYAKDTWQGFERAVRDNRQLSQEQKVRLVMNHIQKICKIYQENILDIAPGVIAEPKNVTELQDKKSAELNNSVLKHLKDDTCASVEMLSDLEDFINIGEVWTKVFWDPTKGEYLGEESVTDPDTGEVVKTIPRFKGKLELERLYAFNIIRPKTATSSMRKLPWICHRKMTNFDDLKTKLEAEGKGDIAKKLSEGKNETFVVFSNVDGSMREGKGEVMVKEFYFRPCMEYPKGYFYYVCEEHILWEGELPFGIFPIVSEGAESIQTTPRCFSPIRHMRPFQVEINRCASKIAEHQVTLGDDKLVSFGISKLSKGAEIPGLRHYTVSGNQAPVVIEGRSGAQYMEYYSAKISELYQCLSVDEDSAMKGQQDPYAMLFQNSRQKKKFAKMATRYENFVKAKWGLALEIFRMSAPDDYVIEVIGKSEQVNISELREAPNKRGFKITVEAISDDLDTVFGKQLVLNNVLQYAQGLEKDDVGRIIKAMPFLQKEDAVSELAMNYEIATNVILALDRGEQPPIAPGEDHNYMIKKLNFRMGSSDFQFLDEQIKFNYQNRLVQHEQMAQQQLLQLKQMQDSFIPTSGPLIGVDFYVGDPANPTRTRRARIPMDAVRDLVSKLEAQGTAIAQLEVLPEGERAKIAEGFNAQASAQQGVSNGNAGAANPSPESGEFTGAVTGQPGGDVTA